MNNFCIPFPECRPATTAKTRQKFSLCENLFEKLPTFSLYIWPPSSGSTVQCSLVPLLCRTHSLSQSSAFNRSPALPCYPAIILIKEIVFLADRHFGLIKSTARARSWGRCWSAAGSLWRHLLSELYARNPISILDLSEAATSTSGPSSNRIANSRSLFLLPPYFRYLAAPAIRSPPFRFLSLCITSWTRWQFISIAYPFIFVAVWHLYYSLLAA